MRVPLFRLYMCGENLDEVDELFFWDVREFSKDWDR